MWKFGLMKSTRLIKFLFLNKQICRLDAIILKKATPWRQCLKYCLRSVQNWSTSQWLSTILNSHSATADMHQITPLETLPTLSVLWQKVETLQTSAALQFTGLASAAHYCTTDLFLVRPRLCRRPSSACCCESEKQNTEQSWETQNLDHHIKLDHHLARAPPVTIQTRWHCQGY